MTNDVFDFLSSGMFLDCLVYNKIFVIDVNVELQHDFCYKNLLNIAKIANILQSVDCEQYN